jgi:hypothetical protein
MHPITGAPPATLCYLSGEPSAIRDGGTDASGRGFIFGDGIREYLPSFQLGQPLCSEEHMARLEELASIVAPGGQAIGNGRPNPIYDSLYKACKQVKVRNAQKHGAPA